MRMKNKLVCGVGVNDSYDIVNKNNAYGRWCNMIHRCYSEKVKMRVPTYIGCTVCDEWKYFSNFKKWFDVNHKEGFQLDKDILVQGNKIYSPDTCVFIPQYLNLLLIDRGLARGDLPLGISRNHNSYMASCSDGHGKQLTKTFKTIEEAVAWYSATKKRVVAEQVQRALDEGAIDQHIADAFLKRNFC